MALSSPVAELAAGFAGGADSCTALAGGHTNSTFVDPIHSPRDCPARGETLSLPAAFPTSAFQTVNQDVALTFNAAQNGTWKLYGFDGSQALHLIASNTVASATLMLNALPAMSANPLVIPDNDGIFKNGFEPLP